MKKLITATALFLALATASGAVPYNAADNAFSAYAVGPGLNNLSIRLCTQKQKRKGRRHSPSPAGAGQYPDQRH